MNTSTSSTQPALSPREISPLILALALAIRVRAAFGECLESTSRIIVHLRTQIVCQARESAAVAEIDDEMEAVAPDLWQCLKNDPPAIRLKIWTAWQITHARTEARSAALNPRCPGRLMSD